MAMAVFILPISRCAWLFSANKVDGENTVPPRKKGLSIISHRPSPIGKEGRKETETKKQVLGLHINSNITIQCTNKKGMLPFLFSCHA